MLISSDSDILQTLNNYSTDLSILFNNDLNTTEIINNHTTDLSLFNSLINIVNTSTAIHGVEDIIFDTPLSNSNAAAGVAQSACLTKIDPLGKLNIFHPYNLLLLTKLQGFWIVHDEIEGFHQQAIINAGKFLLHDGQIDAVTIVAAGAAKGVAAIILYLGIGSIISAILGGGGDTPPAPIDVSGINQRLNINEYNINSLSRGSVLSINNLNSTTTTILGYINDLTTRTIFNIGSLTVSGNSTLLSALNVSGFTTLLNVGPVPRSGFSGLFLEKPILNFVVGQTSAKGQ
jgi:hypothetical protein